MLELNKIYCGDCLDLMREMPDKSVDLVLTDPPYGLGFPYLSYDDTKENLIKLINGFFPEAIRIGKRVAISSGISNYHLYPSADWIISCSWNTTGNHGKLGFNQWFPVLFYGKDISGFKRSEDQYKSDTIFINGGGGVGFQRDCLETQHVCPKPMNLWKRILHRLSLPGDIVFDPFMGSGTTCVACVKTGRKYIGIDKEPAYVEIARKRLEKVNNHKITDFFGVDKE